jgi:hypothetical protein
VHEARALPAAPAEEVSVVARGPNVDQSGKSTDQASLVFRGLRIKVSLAVLGRSSAAQTGLRPHSLSAWGLSDGLGSWAGPCGRQVGQGPVGSAGRCHCQ